MISTRIAARLSRIFSLVIVLSMLLSSLGIGALTPAFAQGETPEEPTATVEPTPTEETPTTTEPTAEPSPTVDNTATPENTPTLENTATPEVTATLESTPTETPTETPTLESSPTEVLPTPDPAMTPTQDFGDVSAQSNDLLTVYISPTGSNSNNCSTPATACRTFGYGLGHLATNGTMYVAVDTFTGDGSVYPMFAIFGNIQDNITFSGGWNNTFTSQVGHTTIDGSGTQRPIYHASGTLTIDRFTFLNGEDPGHGGGVNTAGTVIITNSAFVGNLSGTTGAALYVDTGGTAYVTNTTFSGNQAGTRGAAVSSRGTLVVLNNVTIAGNTATSGAGGIYLYGGSLQISNSIVAGNTGGIRPNCEGTITSNGYNLIGDTTGCTFSDTTGDLLNVSAGLSALQTSPSRHYQLLGSSPALDAGNPATPGSGGSACPATDQVGRSRPTDGNSSGTARCDIGAYEANAGTTAPGSLVIVSGNNQVANLNSNYGQPLSVRLLNGSGSPMAGFEVTFSAPESGVRGVFQTTGTHLATVTTGVDGVATAPQLVAADVAGSFAVSAAITQLPGNVAFSLEVVEAVGDEIQIIAGNNQFALTLATFSTNFVARLLDGSGNPVGGAVLEFTAPASGASGTFQDSGTNSTTATTGPDGVATAAVFTANGEAGNFAVVVSASGVLETAEYALQNRLPVPDSLEIVSGDEQAAEAGYAYSQPLKVRVRDQYGELLSGIEVTFTAPASGASGSFQDSGTNSTTATTGPDGVATAAVLTANGEEGSFAVVVSAAGVLETVEFALQNRIPVPDSVELVSGDEQIAEPSIAYINPLKVLVRDQYGEPLSGIEVTFTAPASAPGGVFADSSTNVTTAVTDGDGIATSAALIANGEFEEFFVVVASLVEIVDTVEFNLEINEMIAITLSSTTSGLKSARPSARFPSGYSVTVRDLLGNPIVGRAVTFTAPTSGPSAVFDETGTNAVTVLTGASGIATITAPYANAESGEFSIEIAVADSIARPTVDLVTVAGTAWYMDPDAPSTSPGCLTIETACGHITSVLNNAAFTSGDTVYVQAGTYSWGSGGTATTVMNIAVNANLLGGWDENYNNQTGQSIINFNNNGRALQVQAGATVLVENLTFLNVRTATNTTVGGVINNLGTLTLNRVGIQSAFLVQASSMPEFAALIRNAGTLTVLNSAIYNNSTDNFHATGIAINNLTGATLLVENTSIIDNQRMGAILGRGTVTVRSSSIINNLNSGGSSGFPAISRSAGTLTVSNTIVSGNQPSNCGTFTSAGNNLIANTQSCNIGNVASDLKNVNPSLLARVNDARPYYPLSLGSPAVEAGNDALCAVTDMLGNSRADGDMDGSATCDIGAVEASVPPALGAFTSNSGDGQSRTPNNLLAEPFAVLLLDENNLPYAGAPVTFTAPVSGPSGLFEPANALTATVLTNASGIATAPSFRVNGEVGEITIVAEAFKSGTTVEFAAEIVPAVPDGISATTGSNQYAHSNTAFLNPLSATVLDQFGHPLPALTVTFTAPASGPSLVFTSSGTNVATAVTNASGVATVTGMTANGLIGGYFVSATAVDLVATADFQLGNVDDWYVATTGNDSNSCVVPASPCRNVNAVMNKTGFVEGDTILVATGNYTYSGTGDAVINITKDVNILGGWNSTFSTQNGYSTIDGQNTSVAIRSVAADLWLDRLIVQNGYNGSFSPSLAGGIDITGPAEVTISASIIQNNVGVGAGGLQAYNLDLLLWETSLINNTGVYSGGARFAYVEVSVYYSLIANNTSTGLVAGIDLVESDAYIINSTVSGNNKQGIRTHANTNHFTFLNNTTVANNVGPITSAGTQAYFVVANSILANNSATTECSGYLFSESNNLFTKPANCNYTAGPNDVVVANALLGPLAENGGPTRTHELLPGSPAIDTGSTLAVGSSIYACRTVDQRGFTRPRDGDGNGSVRCDKGAFEVVAGVTVPNNIPANATVINSLPFTTTQDTRRASFTNSDPIFICGDYNDASVFYKYVIPANGLYAVNTFGSNYDTVLHVYNSDGTQQLACSSNADTEQAAAAAFIGTAGQTVLIAVTSDSGAGDTIMKLNMERIDCAADELCIAATSWKGESFHWGNAILYDAAGEEVSWETLEYGYVRLPVPVGGPYELVVNSWHAYIRAGNITSGGLLSLTAENLPVSYFNVKDRNGTQVASWLWLIDEAGVSAYVGDTPQNGAMSVSVPDGTYTLLAVSEDAATIAMAENFTVNGGLSTLDTSQLTWETISVEYDGLDLPFFGVEILTTNMGAIFSVPQTAEITVALPPGVVARYAPMWDIIDAAGTWNYQLDMNEGFTVETQGDNVSHTVGGDLTPTLELLNQPYTAGSLASARIDVRDAYNNLVEYLWHEPAGVTGYDIVTPQYSIFNSGGQAVPGEFIFEGNRVHASYYTAFQFQIPPDAPGGEWFVFADVAFGGIKPNEFLSQSFTLPGDEPPVVPDTLIQNTDPRLVFTGPWNLANIAATSGGSQHTSSVIGSTARTVFYGNGFSVLFTKHSSNTKLDVYLNGVKVGTIDQFQSSKTGYQVAWTYPSPLALGTHVLELRHAGTGGKTVTVDAVRIAADIVAPTPVGLTSPAHLANTTSTRPTFSWQKPTADTVRYQLQVATSPDFASPLLDIELTALSYNVPVAQALGYGEYYWRVRAYDGPGNESDWSTVRTLRVTILTAPPEGNITDVTRPNFTWAKTTGALEYMIQIDDSAAFDSPEVSQSVQLAVKFSPSMPLAQGTHYWRARVRTAAGWSAWMPAQTIVISNPRPGLPLLTSPTNKQLTNDNTPLLTWNPVDRAETYEIVVARDKGFKTILFTQNVGDNTNFTLTTLPDGVYHWRVRGITMYGLPGNWSGYSIFTVDTVAPGVPLLTGPVDLGSVAGAPLNAWKAPGGGPARYEVQYATDAGFTDVVYTSPEVASLNHRPAFSLLGTYYWRVRARDAAMNWGAWSGSRRITITPPIAPAPVLLLPKLNLSTNDTTPEVSWSAVPYGVTYQLQWDSTSKFTNPTTIVTGATSHEIPDDFPHGRVVFWRVRTLNINSAPGAWSKFSSFSIDTLASPAPNVSAPANFAVVNTATPLFVWARPAGDVSQYELQISAQEDYASLVYTTLTPVLKFALPPANALPFGRYYWRVRAIDRAGNISDWREMNLTVTLAKSPTDNAIITNTLPAFSWVALTGALEYEIQVDGDSDFSSPEFARSNIVALSTAPAAPFNTGVYFWRLRARTAGGWQDWMPALTLKISPPAPVAPGLLAPANGATLNTATPELSWNTSPNAHYFQVMIATNSKFTNGVQMLILDPGELSIILNALPAGTYYWKVRGFTEFDLGGAWSAYRWFKLVP